MLIQGLHHAAFRCRDALETVEFYTRILGLKFSHALGQDRVPSTGQYSPHIHVFLEMADGSCIAFFECPRNAGETSGRDPLTPAWIQHFAFRVASEAALAQAEEELKARGIDVLGPIDHGGFVRSIYFQDPSGHRLEACVDTAAAGIRTRFRAEAMKTLLAWNETRDWSHRNGGN